MELTMKFLLCFVLLLSTLSPKSIAQTFYKFTGNIYSIIDGSSDGAFRSYFELGQSASYVIMVDQARLAETIRHTNAGPLTTYLKREEIGYTNFFSDYVCGDAIMDGYHNYEYFRAYNNPSTNRSGAIVGKRLDIQGSVATIAGWEVGQLFEVKNYRSNRQLDGYSSRWLYVKDAVLERIVSADNNGDGLLAELCPQLSFEERTNVCVAKSLTGCAAVGD